MAQVVQPGVVQGMDPAQLWQAQQALNLQRQSLMQNMAQNQINQSQVRNQKKAQEFTAYDKVTQGLIDASNGDLILAMGINPGLFKYGFMKFSGMSADQAEIAVENIRQAGIQNPDVIQKLRFKDVLLDPNLPAYLRQSQGQTQADSGVGKQNASLKGETKPATTTPKPATVTPVDAELTPPQTSRGLRDNLIKAATDNQLYMAGSSGSTSRGMSTFASDRAPYTGDPLYKKDRAAERSADFAQRVNADGSLRRFIDEWSAKGNNLGAVATKGLEAYINATGTDEELKTIYGSLSPEEIAELRKSGNIEWGQYSQNAVGKSIEQTFGITKTRQNVDAERTPKYQVPNSPRNLNAPPDPLKPQGTNKTFPIGVPQTEEKPVSQLASGDMLAQAPFVSDAGNSPERAAFQAAPQLGTYQGRAEDTEVPDPSSVPGGQTFEPYGASKIARSLGTILGLGTNAIPDIEAGLIAARNVPGVKAFESVATTNPDKAKASPMTPRIGEALRQAGQKVRASMAIAAQSLRGEVPFNEPTRKAWRDSQLQIENTKAEDFLGQYKIASDQMLERMDRIYRNPKGAEASYQDFVAHALAGGEGYLNKKNMDNAVDSLIAQVNQWAAQNTLANRELDLKDKWATAELAATAMKSASSSTPPGMDPELWKMINKQVETMMKNATDKNGRVSNNGLIEQLQVGNNQQVWDMYNIGVYRLFGGQGSTSSKGYQAWAGPAGLGNFARGILAWVFPGSRWAQTKYLQEFGNVTTFNPSVDVTQNEQGYDSSKDAQYQQLLADLSRTFGLK
jgi:hypothetical protein